MATATLTSPSDPPISSSTNPNSTSTTLPATTSIPITVTFHGGLAPLFNNITTHEIHLPLPSPSLPSQTSSPPTISHLIQHLTTLFLSPSTGTPKSKREMFVSADNERTVRPGILVLVNEADWELLGEADAELGKGDEVVFVSTLHGG